MSVYQAQILWLEHSLKEKPGVTGPEDLQQLEGDRLKGFPVNHLSGLLQPPGFQSDATWHRHSHERFHVLSLVKLDHPRQAGLVGGHHNLGNTTKFVHSPRILPKFARKKSQHYWMVFDFIVGEPDAGAFPRFLQDIAPTPDGLASLKIL